VHALALADRTPTTTRRHATLRPAEVAHAATVSARYARQADERGRLNAETLAALDVAGFARHFSPGRPDGAHGTFTELFDAAVAVAEGCPSAAWCGTLWAVHARYAARLPEEGRAEIWARSSGTRIAAAILPPAGRAERAAGGWRLTGRWSMASGAEWSDWLLLAAPAGEHRGDVRAFAVPRTAVTVHDTWDGTGLRATGSHAVSVREVLVPDHRTAPFAALLDGSPEPGPRCHTVPAHLPGPLLFAAPALGAARHALAAFTERMPAASPVGGATAAADALARSATEIDSVALLWRRAIGRADAGPTDAAAVARNRRDAAYGVETLVTAVDRLLRAGGGAARGGTDPLQRCWRDVHTVAAHGALRTVTAAQAYAAVTVG